MNAPVPSAAPGLDFSRFSSVFPGSAETPATTGRQRKDPAKIWLNFGYQRRVKEDGVEKLVFVSLPFGIPVDTQDAKDLKGSNNMLQLRKWQNELLEEVVNIGNSLQPGEEKILALDTTNGLAIQIRRVRDEVEADQIDSGERFQLRCHGEGEKVAENA